MPTVNGRGSFDLSTLNKFFLDGPRLFGKYLCCGVFVRVVIRSDWYDIKYKEFLWNKNGKKKKLYFSDFFYLNNNKKLLMWYKK
jgi:hypothetical protein